MNSTASAARAASAAQLALLAGLISLSLLVTEANRAADVRPGWVVLLAIALAASTLLHFIFMGLLARRMGWPVGQVVGGAVLTLPLGSIVGLVLFEWRFKVEAPLTNDQAGQTKAGAAAN